MNSQNFFLVDEELSWDWSSQVGNQAKIDAVCGLGYEKANADAQGWLARAIYEREQFKWQNIYSIQLVPQKLQYQWHVQVPTTEPVDTPE